jgi:RHS repeat-associated protein
MTTTANGISHFGYDGLYRLTSWTPSSGQVTQWFYDAVGNRTKMISSAATTNYSYNTADELLLAGTSSYTYDGNGSQITKTTGGVTVNYGWDALNRLAAVVGGAVDTVYAYDGDGNRVSQQIPTGTYNYSNDSLSTVPGALSESGPDGSLDYSYGLSMISVTAAGFQYYHQEDGLGSTINLTDATGAQKANYSYDPWGRLTTPLDPVGSKDKYKFTGQVTDANSVLEFLRSRYYDPTIGRFISQDPLLYRTPPEIGSAYAYALSNPLRLSDPLGLSAVDATSGSASNLDILTLSDQLRNTSSLSRQVAQVLEGPSQLLQSLSFISAGLTVYREFQDPNATTGIKLGRASTKILLTINPWTGIPYALGNIIAPQQTAAFTNHWVDTSLNAVALGGTVKGVAVPGLAGFINDVIFDFGSNTRTIFNSLLQ